MARAEFVRTMTQKGYSPAGVPTVWTLLLNYLAQTGKKVPTLKKTLVGGSAVPLSMIKTFE